MAYPSGSQALEPIRGGFESPSSALTSMIPAKLYSSSVTQFPPCNSSCILLICIVKIQKTSYVFKMKASRCRGGKRLTVTPLGLVCNQRGLVLSYLLFRILIDCPQQTCISLHQGLKKNTPRMFISSPLLSNSCCLPTSFPAFI